MAPLFYTHLKAAGIPIPFEAQRQLRGFCARHRHASRVQTRTLRDVLTAYNAAGIQALVLKPIIRDELLLTIRQVLDDTKEG